MSDREILDKYIDLDKSCLTVCTAIVDPIVQWFDLRVFLLLISCLLFRVT